MSCVEYQINLIDFLFPNLDILYKVCSVRSKTLLFIVCLIRIFIMYYFYKISITSIYSYVFLLLLALNMIVFVLILIKKPRYSEDQIKRNLQQDVDYIRKELENDVIDRSDQVKLATKVFDPEIITPVEYIDRSIS